MMCQWQDWQWLQGNTRHNGLVNDRCEIPRKYVDDSLYKLVLLEAVLKKSVTSCSAHTRNH